MKKVNINDMVVGSVLAEPVYINGVLLIKEGTPVSATLREAFKKFGLTEIPIESVFTENIDKSALSFSKLSNMTYLAVKRLDIDQIITCAKTLTQDLVSNDKCPCLDILYEYDLGTYQHSLNVAELAVTCGINMGLSISDLNHLAMGALLHDIGKYEIPLDILNKPEKLNEYEYDIIKKHPQAGYDILKNYESIATPVKQIVWQHHENYDGTGYPRGLFGINSYRLARIIHICDVYEALCAKRSYKERLPRRVVREIMQKNSGTMFDPILLREFLSSIPLYFIGEEITVDNRVGIVSDNTDKDNPIIYCDGSKYWLSDFENISNEIDMESLRINT